MPNKQIIKHKKNSLEKYFSEAVLPLEKFTDERVFVNIRQHVQGQQTTWNFMVWGQRSHCTDVTNVISTVMSELWPYLDSDWRQSCSFIYHLWQKRHLHKDSGMIETFVFWHSDPDRSHNQGLFHNKVKNVSNIWVNTVAGPWRPLRWANFVLRNSVLKRETRAKQFVKQVWETLCNKYRGKRGKHDIS